MSPNTHQTINVHAVSPAEVESSLLSPDVSMLILTWITFFLLLAVLYKFAWKPILAALDTREESIRKSLEDVDRIKGEMEQINETRAQLIAEAEAKGEAIIDYSRKAATEAANIIGNKAREEAKISLENAVRDIKEETQKAQVCLRKESAQIAVDLAAKLIEENIDIEKNRKLINQFVKEI